MAIWAYGRVPKEAGSDHWTGDVDYCGKTYVHGGAVRCQANTKTDAELLARRVANALSTAGVSVLEDER